MVTNTRSPSGTAIPAVDFYGETGTWPISELVHSEKLVERSALHNWRIRAHRHNETMQLFLLKAGRGVARLDAEAKELKAPCIVIIPERVVHEFRWSDSSDGWVVSVRSSLLRTLATHIGRSESAFSKPEVIKLEPAEKFVFALFRQIHTETELKLPLMDQALESLLQTLAVWLARRAGAPSETSEPLGRAAIHFNKFRHLVEEHHKDQWTVAQYGSALGITASHLNAICQQSAGQSALNLIHTRLLTAARRQLTYTERSISGIAANLGFVDPSYFSRFFRRAMDMSPGEFRRRSGTHEGA